MGHRLFPPWVGTRAISAALVIFFASTCSGGTGIDKGEIVGIATVIDGDTIEINDQRIRPAGFDMPAKGKRCGLVDVNQKAAFALSELIGGDPVSCLNGKERDSFGRVVATCYVRGSDLGDAIVHQGWARDWPQYSGGKYCATEQDARAAKRGLWGLGCPDTLWDGRRHEGCPS